MPLNPSADIVFADGPLAAPYQPQKPEIRKIFKQVEQAIDAFSAGAGSIAKATKAQLDADLARGADVTAWVYNDPTVANNGIYRKVGASGSGSWNRILDLPFSFIVASNPGAGTANAIQATTSIPVSSSALVILPVAATNTATPVTVSFNGGSALTIKSNSGEDVDVGGVLAGSVLLGVVSGATFRLLSDQAIAQSLYAARDEAIAARDIALDAAGDTVAQGNVPIFASRDTASTYDLSAFSKVTINRWSVSSEIAPADYKKVGAEPAHAAKFQDSVGNWWGLVPGRVIRPEMFGAIAGSAYDSINSLTNMYSAALSLACDVELFTPYYVKSGTLVIPESVVTFTHGEAFIAAIAPGVVVKEGPTIMYRPLGGGQVRGIFVDVPKGVGGSAGANPHSYNYFRIQKDQLDGVLGAGSKVNGLFINHGFGGEGTKGGRHAIEGRLVLSEATDALNPDRNYCAVAGFGLATVSDGGVTGAERGAIFGMNPQGRLSGTATGFLNVTAGEANVGIAAGSSAKIRSGWSIVGLGDPVRGTDVDAGLSISNYGDPVTGAYFTDGILLGSQNGRPALREFSTVLRVQGNSQRNRPIGTACHTST